MDVIIIGMGPDRVQAPLFIKTGEIWGCNGVHKERHLDLLFQMHDHIDTSELSIPVISKNNYPIAEVKSKFGGMDYFSNTIAYMIAYALYKEVDSMSIFGVVNGTDDERLYQKGSIEFWLGVAFGRGVPVMINSDYSMLLRTKRRTLYAYDSPQKQGRANKGIYSMPEPIKHFNMIDGALQKRGSFE